MAEAFVNARQAVGTSLTDVYTCPTATKAIVIHCQAAAVDVAAAADLTLQWTDASASNAATHLAKAITIPPQAALNPIVGRLVLEAGDKIRAQASAAAKLELSLSVLEIS
jgi:hypothetical protein